MVCIVSVRECAGVCGDQHHTQAQTQSTRNRRRRRLLLTVSCTDRAISCVRACNTNRIRVSRDFPFAPRRACVCDEIGGTVPPQFANQSTDEETPSVRKAKVLRPTSGFRAVPLRFCQKNTHIQTRHTELHTGQRRIRHPSPPPPARFRGSCGKMVGDVGGVFGSDRCANR